MYTIINKAEKYLQFRSQPTVGIVTPYVAQRNKLLTAKANIEMEKVKGIKRLKVYTVNSYIEREQDIIILILLCVKDSLGFLVDIRRINVALTRA